jgi:uncharacterized protein (TIGR02145 family)
MLPATYTLNVSALSFCADSEGVQFALSGTEDGRHYQLYRDGVAVDGAVLAGTGDAGTFGTFSEAGTYTAQTITDEKYCAIAMNGTHIIAAYPAFTAGEIATSSTTTPAGTNPNVTVESLSPTLGGSGNTTYLWLRTGTSSATLTDNGVATYMIGSGDYSAAGTHYFNRYAKDATCNTDWVAAAGTYTLMVEFNGVNQPQGQCTFTQPPVVGTFANFDPDYSASTFVTLTDERDCNNYTVVKIGGRWIMGQNLNYQKGLTYFNTHATPSKDIHSNPALRGGFWCPSNSSGTISVTACDYWGALYAWETAMTLDGKDTWTYTGEFGDCYDALNSAACKQNHGRSTSDGLTSGGRGICPPNWHVPTAYEWGVLWDAMEETPSTVISNSSGGQWWGTSAGDRAKAACAECTDAPNNCWDSKGGSDAFNFRVLPACVRDWQGEAGTCIGTTAVFFSSSFSKWGANSACFVMNNIENGVLWSYMNLSQGNSVRCIRN